MSHSEIMIQLKQQAMNLEKKIGAINEIEQVFHDLAEKRDRWGTCYMTSQSANSRVNKVKFRVSCGCCNDALVFAQPYLEINGYKVHSSPFEIEIGCQSPYGLGIIETPGWKENLKNTGSYPRKSSMWLKPTWLIIHLNRMMTMTMTMARTSHRRTGH